MSVDEEDTDILEAGTEANNLMKTEGILSGFKMTEDIANIGHIDSSETSDESPEAPTMSKKEIDRKRSLSEDRAFPKSRRYGRNSTCDKKEEELPENDATNIISTSPEEEVDDDGFSDELGLKINESKRCSLAHFVDGFDIARRSIKCRHRNVGANLGAHENLTTNKDTRLLTVPTIQIDAGDDDSSVVGMNTNRLLDMVKLRINGSNSNISSTSGIFLGDNFSDVEHRKSLTPSEGYDDELVRFHEMAHQCPPKTCEGPVVVVDPPSPPTVTLEIPEEESDYLRRPSFEFCRKCEYQLFSVQLVFQVKIIHVNPITRY